MSGVNLPHDHGQNIEKVLERMPDVDECAIVAEVYYGCYVTVRSV